ncbi:MAG: AAA family ATPase [Planctomycetota bacterium]
MAALAIAGGVDIDDETDARASLDRGRPVRVVLPAATLGAEPPPGMTDPRPTVPKPTAAGLPLDAAQVAAALPVAALRRRVATCALPFTTTADLAVSAATVGQERALEALAFGIAIPHDGYGMFAVGPPGTGRHTLVRRRLEAAAARQPVPPDWCYVHDFAAPQRPRALRLPPGRGAALRADMKTLVDDLRVALPAAFESEEFRGRKDAIANEYKEKHEQALEAIAERAKTKSITLVRTVGGVALAPVRDGEVMDRAEFAKLPDAEKERIQREIETLQAEVQAALRELPKLLHEQRTRLRALNREVTELAVGHLIDHLRQRYADLPEVCTYLAAVERDIIDNAEQFVAVEPTPPESVADLATLRTGVALRRYEVNVLVDHGKTEGAPVIYEDQPSYHNLLGRIEHIAQLGTLVTDFTQVKAGALHRANGGYLILDARQVLAQPFVWEDLKRAMRAHEVRIQSLADKLSLIATVSLDPTPIPLQLKVVLVGERWLYYALSAFDPEFGEHFKVPLDFDDSTPWGDDTPLRYARVLAQYARQEKLRPLDRDAVARIVEEAARLAGDRERLTTHVSRLFDLVREADHWAGLAQHRSVTDADVGRAIDAGIRRADRVRERIYDEIARGTLRVETSGARVGQVNGLSVVELGGFRFGQPSRITARVRLGRGEVMDIEREVELGGPLHSKGVLILGGFLGARFAAQRPLALSASLVFEQSYGGVEGDSASAAELFALLSALAEVPIRQSLAVTGSVDQHGCVQAIGGVDAKVEGFFDVCAAGGLTGEQGVLVPAANVQHLMLRQDVVAACAEGRFHVWAIDDIDQGIEMLTGIPAGERGEDGVFPQGSLNRRVDDRLAILAERARQFAAESRREVEP